MTPALGFEILLAALLVLTVIYCWRLDRRLNALRNGQDGMRNAVQDLVNATIKAETSIQGMRATADESCKALDLRITSARKLAADLQRMEQRGQNLGQINTLAGPAHAHSNSGMRRSSLMDRLKEAG